MKPLPICLAALLILTGCSENTDDAWLGYAEADYVYIAAPAAGWLTEMEVERGAEVHVGTALFTLDADNQTAARDSAEAGIKEAEGQLAAAEAGFDLAAKELKRQKALYKSNATTKQLLDQAQSNYDSAAAALEQIRAARDAARASLTSAAYNLSQRTIVARAGGRVQDIYFRPGEYAPAQTPVLSVLPPQNIYIRFFVPETQYAKLKLGRKVRIDCDGCSPITATVTFIASTYEYAPPVVFSVGNRDKLVFKVEARADGGLPLHPGQPVDVRPIE